MSLERALAPLAVAVAVIALVVWLMLINDIWLGPWLLALLVFAHGWVHRWSRSCSAAAGAPPRHQSRQR